VSAADMDRLPLTEGLAETLAAWGVLLSARRRRRASAALARQMRVTYH
jgi:ribosomal 50S subunit-associated protein YjgA (DUF615 family)